jgi:hypothetical protein
MGLHRCEAAGRIRYSQKGMATGQKTGTAQGRDQGFVFLPLIVGWLVPGAGHFLLKKWGRGALLAASIVGMFAIGLAMQGQIHTGAKDILDVLSMAGDLGTGLLYVAGRVMSWGNTLPQETTQDWGSRFIVVAGLLNVIAAVDAHNLRTGRKAS